MVKTEATAKRIRHRSVSINPAPRQTPPQILTAAEAAAVLDLRPTTLERLRWLGVGPAYKRQGGRIFYDFADVVAWSKHSRRRSSLGTLVVRTLTGALALLALFVTFNICKRPLLVWNASASVPAGLYRVVQRQPREGDLTLVRLNGRMARLAGRRGYLAASAYLLKPVVAGVGDRVCRFGTHVIVGHSLAARAQVRDRHARPMPAWQGCRTLAAGELFLLADRADSFDSRYFGPISAGQVAGIAFLLWPAHAI